MPVAAQCPNCGKNLSETSVVAGAPHCTACGAWIVGVNGTLGLTSAYGHGDSSLTRKRVEADLTVLREYQTRYTGMMEDCKQKMGWSVEQYAKYHKMLPQPPVLLELEASNTSIGQWCFSLLAIFFGIKWILAVNARGSLNGLSYYTGVTSGTIYNPNYYDFGGHRDTFYLVHLFLCALICSGLIVPCLYLRILVANGKKPQENARRERAYEEDMATAMRDAERNKSAEDHRLRVQIRELEGEIKAVGDKAEDVRRILTSL